MFNKKPILIIAFIFINAWQLCQVKAQVLQDTTTFGLMKRGVDYIYNLQFDEAMDIYFRVRQKYPEHPLVYVYKGLLDYWKDYPLLPNSPTRKDFESNMMKAVELCDEKRGEEADAECVLASIGARGMLLMFYADNELSGDVFRLATGTYYYVKRSFDLTGVYPDFYFVTGLYNYYREAYPEAHPVYKTLAFLFPKGDKSKGLSELRIAANRAIVLKAEAYTFLSGIYISFENNFSMAFRYSKSLHELYPQNPQYLANYIKNLILVKQYNEAENLIKANQTKISDPFFQAQMVVYNGILYEKKYRNYSTASAYYKKGIRDLAPYGEFANEYTAYAYFGLSRISEINNDKQGRRSYRNKAEDIADYENVNFDD